MSTPLTDIYNLFLNQIDDDILAIMSDEVIEDMLLTYLKGSITEFNTCVKDIEIEGDSINCDLDLDEQFILVRGMIIYWLNPKILSQNIIKNRMTSRDYSQYSPANLLDKLIKLKESTQKDQKKAKIKYSYKHKKVNS